MASGDKPAARCIGRGSHVRNGSLPTPPLRPTLLWPVVADPPYSLSERFMVDPRTVAQDLAREVCQAFGADVRSVVLFGSVARGEAIPGVSDVNILVLLEAVTPAELAKAAPLAVRWVRAGNTPPLTYSWDEWSGMGDTFAIEMSDMLDAHEVIHGDDPLSGVVLTGPDLRLHVERELRELILQLRTRMLLSAGDPLELANLLLSAIPSFSAYMRAALRLRGEVAANETETVISRAAELIGADAAPMLVCQTARRAQRVPDISIDSPLVEAYLDFARGLVGYIDGLPSHTVDDETPEPSGPSLVERAR